MVIKERWLIDAEDLVDEVRALDVIDFWNFRSSLFARYDLPNMESLWIILLKAAIARQQNQKVAIDALAVQFGQSVDVISRMVTILSNAGMLVQKQASHLGFEIKITTLGEKLVAEGLGKMKS